MSAQMKRGMLIRHQNHLYTVEAFDERHSGKMKPTVHVTLRDLVDGRVVERLLEALLPLEEVPHQYRTLQFLYAAGDSRIFMDSTTFEEFSLEPRHLLGAEPFLAEGTQYRVMFADEKPVFLEMPDNVPLRVSVTAAAGHSVGGGGSVLKEATLENGLMVRVPLFIKPGECILVDTRSRTYAGREHE